MIPIRGLKSPVNDHVIKKVYTKQNAVYTQIKINK